MNARKLENSRGSRLKSHFRLIGVILLLTALVAVIQATALWFRPLKTRAVPPDLAFEILTDRASPSTGPRVSGKVVVAIFTDYQCAVCRADHDVVMLAAKSNPDVRFIFKEWAILGSRSLIAARIALAARYQGRYVEFRDALMRRGVAREMDGFEATAQSVGLNWPTLLKDLDLHASDIDAELAGVSGQAMRLGLRGTPSYLANDELVEGRVTRRQLASLIQTNEPQR